MVAAHAFPTHAFRFVVTRRRWIGVLLAFALVGMARADTLTVTNLNDGGVGSLREAIALANPGDRIAFAPTLDGTITLASPLVVDRALTIDGQRRIVLDGNDATRVLQVTSTGQLQLSALSVQRGAATQGAGVLNEGTLVIDRCLVRDNHAINGGGGIFHSGVSLSVLDSDITDNETFSGGGGGLLDQTTGSTTIARSRITGNMAGTQGGGIWQNSGRMLTITHSTISGNQVASSETYMGGGIATQHSTLNLRYSTVSGNKAHFGGGIYVVALDPTTPATVTIDNSLIAGNTAIGDGGGMFSFGGVVSLTNSTVTLNVSAASSGGGLALQNTAGVPASMRLVAVTVARNRAAGVGGGIEFISGTLRLRNSLLGDNVGASDPDLNGAFTSEGFNLVTNRGSSTGYRITDLPDGSRAGLGPLAFNGGATNSIVVFGVSAALDAVPPSSCVDAGVLIDQRGYQRPAIGACDIGAYEQEGVPILEAVFGNAFE